MTVTVHYIAIRIENDRTCPECGWSIDKHHHPNCPIGRLECIIISIESDTGDKE